MSRLYIVGAGGHGAVAAETAELLGRWTEIQFLDDDTSKSGKVLSWKIAGAVMPIRRYIANDTEFVVAIGDNRVRTEFVKEIRTQGGKLVSLLHPSAVVSKSAEISPGTVVFANAVVNARASIGSACIVNTGATVDHDCELAAGVHVSPGVHIAGNVAVGERTWIGIGAVVREGTGIGADAVIGAGAAVVADVAARTTVVGIPAERM